MQKFYIFLDIDGVLYDLKSIKNNIKNGNLPTRYSADSISALNFLIANLSKTYDVQLVISSIWKINLKHMEKILKNKGLIYNKPLNKTPLSLTNNRCKEIISFLKDKIDNNNFVVIDNTKFYYYNNIIPKQKIIFTNIRSSALNKTHVDTFLNQLSSPDIYIQ